jgi:hypothetical protein
MELNKKYRVIHSDGIISGNYNFSEGDSVTEFSEGHYDFFETDNKKEAEEYIKKNNLKNPEE